MSFETFRKSKMSLNERVLKAQEKSNSYGDGYNYWKLEIDKDKGTGSAVIRFLPPKDSELPYVKIYSHFFKGDDNRWCIVDRCPSTYGEQCPICNANSNLWNNGQEDKARQRKRRTNYVFNILVVKDPSNPENEGKIFLFKCGPAIFSIITDSMTPQFDGEEPKRPFDLYGGHNFNLRVRSDASRGGLASYDKSFFDEKPTDVAKNDAELERIYNSMVNLDEYKNVGRLDDAELEKKACFAYGTQMVHNPSVDCSNNDTTNSFNSMDKLPWDDDDLSSSQSDEESTLDYFKKLASKE